MCYPLLVDMYCTEFCEFGSFFYILRLPLTSGLGQQIKLAF